MVISKDVLTLKQQVQTLYRVNKFISAVQDIDRLLDLIMQEAEEAVAADASCIGLLEPSGNRIKITYASGEKKVQVQELSLPLGQGILGHVAATGSLLKVDDVSSDQRFDQSIDQKTGFTTRCILAVPISRNDQIIGVLEVINKLGDGPFTYSDVQLLEVIANQAAIALENARLVTKVVESERMAAVGGLAASIVHDFKNPMTVVRGFVELMENSRTDSDDRHVITSMILDDLDRMADMAQDLLDYSKGELRLNIHEVNLGDWLDSRERYLHQFFTAAKMDLKIQASYRGNVYMDPDRMRRVLMNIAGNARDAMSQGATFSVSTGQVGDYWELILEDNGSGIPPEVRPLIFNQFVTHGKAYGSGLGLAITREIIDTHGGTIEVQSAIEGEHPDQPSGTKVFIRFPMSQSSP